MTLRRPGRGLRLLAAGGLLAAAAGGVQSTGASFTDGFSHGLTLKAGSVTLTPEGDALVLDGAQLVPGDTVTGSARLTDSGTLPERLTLAHGADESTAPNGCALRDALRLHVYRVAEDGTRTELSNAALTSTDRIALGSLAPGDTGSYAISITFPARGDESANSADNCVQGSSLRERFTWDAVEDDS